MKRKPLRDLRLWGIVIVAVLIAAGSFVLVRPRCPSKLPYRDSFAHQQAPEWTPMGGSWRVSHGEMINRSDEAGAKLVTGSSSWSDYQVVTDLILRAHGGDVGIVLRVNDPEIGIDAYRGYFVGLRSNDSAIVIGRANQIWQESRPVGMNGGVQIGTWYRLKAVIVGCEIGAEATNLSTGQTSYAAMQDDPADCISHGKIGLRSTDTSGAWRGIHVDPASKEDLESVVGRAASIGVPEYPAREDAYAHMREKYFPDYPSASLRMTIGSADLNTYIPTLTIQSLETSRYFQSLVRLRGVVTFTDPTYLQDGTAGIMLQIRDPESLNIGDEIEVTGHAVASTLGQSFAVSGLHLMRERAFISPISITPTEAAGGTHAGSLVEVTGVVKRRTKRPDGKIALVLADSAQVFAALLEGDVFSNAAQDWTVGSTIRLRGICSIDPEPRSATSFLLLVASASDVTVLSGPPWWSGWRLARWIAIFVALTAAIFYIFVRFERSKHRAVMREREELAHEMHDTLAQSFAGVGYYLQSIRRSLRATKTLPAEAMEELDIACNLVTETHREASASIAALHPDVCEEGELLLLLKRSACSMLGGERLPIILSEEGDPHDLAPPVRDVLFRVGREAISNVLRHAKAASVKLQLCYGPRSVSLSIHDDGSGFSTDTNRGGFGLETMKRRCRAIGGELRITTSPGSGCTVQVTVPYRSYGSIVWWFKSRFGASPA